VGFGLKSLNNFAANCNSSLLMFLSESELTTELLLFCQVNKKDIRAALKTRLPFYMIPSHFVLLARFVQITKKLLAGISLSS